MEFRNIRIKELPTSGARRNKRAIDAAWSSLFNGLDLRGWKTNRCDPIRWHAGGSQYR